MKTLLTNGKIWSTPKNVAHLYIDFSFSFEKASKLQHHFMCVFVWGVCVGVGVFTGSTMFWSGIS